MKWSYRIARVAGIDVRLHATFLLLLAFFAFQGYTIGGPPAALAEVVFVSLLFLCVLLHEFGHALAARRYGILTPDITLLPIGGVARLARMPENPGQEFVIAIAGPMVNVAIALAIWVALGFPPPFDRLDLIESGARGTAWQLLGVNVGLVLFNLIPAFPMDGGRVLRALLAMAMGFEKATRIAARVGQALAVGLAAAGIFGLPGFSEPNNWFLVFIAMFVFSAARQEADSVAMRAAIERRRVGDAMLARFQTFRADRPVPEAVAQARLDPQPLYVVVDAHLRAQGLITSQQLFTATAERVGDAAIAVPMVFPDTSLPEAFRLMQESGHGVLPVVNPAGQIVGLISLTLLRACLEKGT